MTLTIPSCPPSLNQTLRMHWAMRKRMNEAWVVLIRTKLPEVYLKPVVKMRCKITLCHSRLFDRDNAYGAAKPIVDGLRAWKLIVDDTAEYLDLSVQQEKCRHKQRHTIIELEPA